MSITSPSFDDLVEKVTANVTTLLKEAFTYSENEKAVIVYDKRSLLSRVLSAGYQKSLPNAQVIDFDETPPEEILRVLNALNPLDLTVLIQSTSFRLDAFRIRVELFKRKIKVIEHPHLSRMSDDQAEAYVDALHYDADYTRGVGRALKEKIDHADSGVVVSGGETLTYGCAFESAKLNIGDYSEMPNVGGQFPIGEVFTEAIDLKALNGRLKIISFGDIDYKVNVPPKPMTLVIKEGQVIACEDATPAFEVILSNIRRDEGVIWVRELGFGLNRALSKTRILNDTGSYERMCGVHVSLGAKHGMYGKPGFKRRDGMYHVDVFADTERVTLGDVCVFKDGAWSV